MAKTRSARSAQAFARRGPTREPYDYVLIVCEGKKTEPNYFVGLRNEYSLSSANIKIVHGGATDPKRIVEFALSEMGKDPYDYAYCVFDRDGHQTYDAAHELLAQSEQGKNGKLLAITSWPCFEIWILLHFAYSTAPFNTTGSRSAGDKVVAEVVKRMADYTKGSKGIFEVLSPRLTTAIANAKRLEKHNTATSTQNPHTKVHKLVEKLKSLREP